jgi:hypothetical protein
MAARGRHLLGPMAAIALAWACALALCACKEPEGGPPSVGTNSNWLRACTSADQCGDLPACRCGACTVECTRDADCDVLGGGHCAFGSDPAAQAACGVATDPARGLCLPRCEPGGCGEGQACVASACVRAELPMNAFCDGLASAPPADLAAEDPLLQLYSELRAEGGTRCGGGEAAAPVPLLRYDPRLVCAARVLAADIAATGVVTARDSQGRTGRDRMRAAGHAAQLWADGFAFDVGAADAALQLILADAASCERLTSADYGEVGVGVIDDVFVISVGSE